MKAGPAAAISSSTGRSAAGGFAPCQVGPERSGEPGDCLARGLVTDAIGKPGAGDGGGGHRPRAHTRHMGRIIGTILGATLAIWLAFTAAGGILATLKTFLIIGLIAMAVFIVVWLVARRPRRG
jgi:predicted lipid-binding transport protein (Tim44 family)